MLKPTDAATVSLTQAAGTPDRALLQHLRLERQLLQLEQQFLLGSLKVPETVSVKVCTARENDAATERTLLARYAEALKAAKAAPPPLNSSAAAAPVKRIPGKAGAAKAGAATRSSPSATSASKPLPPPPPPKQQAKEHEEVCRRLENEVQQRLTQTIQRRDELEQVLQSLKSVVQGFMKSIEDGSPQ
eukprot:gene8145-biopygen5485